MRLLSPVFERRAMQIDANPERLAQARQWGYEAALAAGFAEPDSHQVKLALSEAVANAIQHGSSAAGDTIGIDAFEEAGSLVFEVRDGGTFVAPLERATIEDESGRGLELLTLMMDEVHITSTGDGSLLRFSKRL
jgi:anti-sigma regulatory factor (Ser/Thr protein kinase)